MSIEADLALTVTSPDGRSTTAHAVGEGSGLRVTTARPDVLLAAVDRSDIGPLADALDALGLSVYVDGPTGQVAVLGSAASSRIGRLLTGSTNSEIRPTGALAFGPRSMLPAIVAAAVALVLLPSVVRAIRAKAR